MKWSETDRIRCFNRWDVESKHVLDVSGICEAIYAGECRYGGGEKYVLYERSARGITGLSEYEGEENRDQRLQRVREGFLDGRRRLLESK